MTTAKNKVHNDRQETAGNDAEARTKSGNEGKATAGEQLGDEQDDIHDVSMGKYNGKLHKKSSDSTKYRFHGSIKYVITKKKKKKKLFCFTLRLALITTCV